jgi:hypothetical protein
MNFSVQEMFRIIFDDIQGGNEENAYDDEDDEGMIMAVLHILMPFFLS